MPEKKKWEGRIPVHYLYTMGLAGERFFREIKDHGRFVATSCSQCKITYVPPRIYCERCFKELNDFHEVVSQGTLETYTVCTEAADGTKLSSPVILAHIRLDGTHGGLIHKIEGIEPSKIRIGMKVAAVFAEKTKRIGHISDIEHFRPV